MWRPSTVAPLLPMQNHLFFIALPWLGIFVIFDWWLGLGQCGFIFTGFLRMGRG